MKKNRKKWWRSSKDFTIEVNEDQLRELKLREAGLLKEVPVTLKINQDTDVRANLRDALPFEKVIKVSNACKTRTWWFKSLFFGQPRHYYKFLCLTTEHFYMINVIFDKRYGSWAVEYENDFNTSVKDLVSAYSRNIKGKDWLVVNYKYLGLNYQIKLPVENPEEWAKEINAAIEKQKQP